jgi:hypothetical protein
MNPWKELLLLYLTALFETSVFFKSAHESGVGPMKILLKKTTNDNQKIKPELNRNSFLLGCLDFTENEIIEHLIIGFGEKNRKRNKNSISCSYYRK